jgi:hypothetical protein
VSRSCHLAASGDRIWGEASTVDRRAPAGDARSVVAAWITGMA